MPFTTISVVFALLVAATVFGIFYKMQGLKVALVSTGIAFSFLYNIVRNNNECDPECNVRLRSLILPTEVVRKIKRQVLDAIHTVFNKAAIEHKRFKKPAI